MEINKLKILYDALIPDDSYFKVTVMPGIDKENPSYADVKSLLHHCIHYKETGFDCVLTAMEDYATICIQNAILAKELETCDEA